MATTTNAKEEVKGTVEIRREGDIILVPERIPLEEALTWIQRQIKEETQDIRLCEIIDCHPLEGALALTKALAKKYGWTSLIATPTWFGPQPPAMVSLPIGVKDGTQITMQVPWGRMAIPGVAGYIVTSVERKDGRWIFKLDGVIRQKHKKEIMDLMILAREFVRDESVYRGKAIRVSFPPISDDFNLTDNCPTFLDVSNVREEELIFSDTTRKQVRVSLFTPVERTNHCRTHNIPLKRGILLEGPYGTGKTLTAYVAARKCVENGWTFIYLESVDQLDSAILFAKKYQPAMIFAEDIDQVLGTSERTDAVNKILNTIDGIDAKNSEVIVVLTTNHVEKLSQAMLRPGRLDAVIAIRPPDAKAVSGLIDLYSRGKIEKGADLTHVCKMLDGKIPAVIREVVESAKLSAVSDLPEGEMEITISADDLTTAAVGMIEHLKLLEPKPEDHRTAHEKIAQILGNAIATGVTTAMRSASLKEAIDVVPSGNKALA